MSEHVPIEHAAMSLAANAVEEVERLRTENARLQQALTGRTVSCTFCETTSKKNEALRKRQDADRLEILKYIQEASTLRNQMTQVKVFGTQQLAAAERRAEEMRKALSAYVGICGNTCYSVTRESALALYTQAMAALATSESAAPPPADAPQEPATGRLRLSR